MLQDLILRARLCSDGCYYFTQLAQSFTFPTEPNGQVEYFCTSYIQSKGTSAVLTLEYLYRIRSVWQIYRELGISGKEGWWWWDRGDK